MEDRGIFRIFVFNYALKPDLRKNEWNSNIRSLKTEMSAYY